MKTKSTFFKWVLPTGKFWVGLWSFVALIRFTLGLPIDPIFLGVLGIYGGHTIAKKFAQTGEDKEV